jgi:hypothetical protein
MLAEGACTLGACSARRRIPERSPCGPALDHEGHSLRINDGVCMGHPASSGPWASERGAWEFSKAFPQQLDWLSRVRCTMFDGMD